MAPMRLVNELEMEAIEIQHDNLGEDVMRKILMVLAVIFWASAAFASNADDISKNVNSLIRSAEKAYFKGEADNAATILQEAEDGLVQLKSEDPAHKSLKTLQKKYDRLKARVDKKLGKSASPAAPKKTAAPSPAQTSPPSKDLSSSAKSNLQKAEREMKSFEQELAKGEKRLEDEKFNLVESSVYRAKRKLEGVKVLLDKVVNNNRASPDHPDVASAFRRHQELQDKFSAFAGRAQGKEESVKQASAQAKEDEAEINKEWLPKVTLFTDTSSSSRLMYPGSYNKQELDRQEKLYDQAKIVLGSVEQGIPAGHQPHDLKRAVDKLRFSLQVYDDEKKADNRNRLQPIETTLSAWEKRFEQNKNWNENSDQGLFVITDVKLEHQKKQIEELRTVSTDSAAGFGKRLAALEKENTAWTEKKRLWLERPRPFPEAKMTSRKLEKEMQELLADRGIEVKDLAITDKDWWVQPDEFRYLATAVLSNDDQGDYWSNVRFRQIRTLTGYGPTELWEIDEIRTRLP